MSARPTLILASTSRYRRELLERLEVPFETDAPDFDERSLDGRFGTMDHTAFALEQARGKARSLVGRYPQALILAADQIAIHPGPPERLLTKPGDEATAVEQLMGLAGQTHQLLTGVVLLDARSGVETTTTDLHRLTMRRFDRAEAQAYVGRHRPVDCVGAYRIEDAGIKLFERIEGEDFTGIIGLPLLSVSRLLRAAGVFEAP